jgi:hypothetical protein
MASSNLRSIATLLLQNNTPSLITWMAFKTLFSQQEGHIIRTSSSQTLETLLSCAFVERKVMIHWSVQSKRAVDGKDLMTSYQYIPTSFQRTDLPYYVTHMGFPFIFESSIFACSSHQCSPNSRELTFQFQIHVRSAHKSRTFYAC